MNIVCYTVLIQKITYIPWNNIHLFLLYICRYKYMCFDTRNYLSTIGYDLLMFTRYIYQKKLHFHEYSMLCCDDQKDYIYSMKCYTFIYPIYICRYKHMCFHTKNYLSITRYDLSMFTRYIYQKNHIFMNVVCYAVIIQKITYIP